MTKKLGLVLIALIIITAAVAYLAGPSKKTVERTFTQSTTTPTFEDAVFVIEGSITKVDGQNVYLALSPAFVKMISGREISQKIILVEDDAVLATLKAGMNIRVTTVENPYPEKEIIWDTKRLSGQVLARKVEIIQ